MRRRDLLALASAVLAYATAAGAQSSSSGPRRIGVLTPQSATEPPSLQREPFEQGLRDLGWMPGPNLSIEYLYAGGSLERLNEMARDLAERKVDLIVARGTAAAVAAKNATNSIPIVLAVTPDPVRTGLVASLARPGGNITGLAFQPQGPLEAKQLELLRDALPAIRRVAVLVNALGQEDALDGSGGATVESAASALGLQLMKFEIRTAEDLPAVLERIASAKPDALLVRADPQILVPNRAIILRFALQHRLPAIYPWRFFVEEGGLMSFGPSLHDLHRQSAVFVDRIFKGEDPANLPVELPTKMELVVNLGSAMTLGVSFTPAVLANVDQLIE